MYSFYYHIIFLYKQLKQLRIFTTRLLNFMAEINAGDA